METDYQLLLTLLVGQEQLMVGEGQGRLVVGEGQGRLMVGEES